MWATELSHANGEVVGVFTEWGIYEQFWSGQWSAKTGSNSQTESLTE